MIDAKVICDSVSESGVRLTTIQARIHRFILPEITRHRMFSFSVRSSRAVPTSKLVDEVFNDPALPVYWGKNKRGMSADEEIEQIEGHAGIKTWWIEVAKKAAEEAHQMQVTLGLHKQIVNRVIEPYQWCDLIVSGTEWDNFFNLRLAADAQPEIQEVARKMKEVMDKSTPEVLRPGQWHLPYVSLYDEDGNHSDPTVAIKCSAARCARVSYGNHDGSEPDVEKDLKLYDFLVSSGHLSPLEHQATPMLNYISDRVNDTSPTTWEPGVSHVDGNYSLWSGTLREWIQYRKLTDIN